MDMPDIRDLSTLLQSLYGEYRFPGMEPGMMALWYEHLQGFGLTTVQRTVRQWARHHTNKPPSLDELVEAVEDALEEHKRAQLPAAPQTPNATLEKIRQAQANRLAEWSPDDALYARLMVRLLEDVPRARWTEQCERWAIHYAPKRQELATWLEKAAVTYTTLYAAQAPRPAPDARTIPRLGQASTGTQPTEPCPHEHLHASGACNDCGECLDAPSTTEKE